MPYGSLFSTGSAGQNLTAAFARISGFNQAIGNMVINPDIDFIQVLHDGFYHISAALAFYSTGTTSVTFHVFRNEAMTRLSTEQTTLANTTNVACGISGILELAAGDEVSIRAMSSVANQVLVLNNSQFTVNTAR